MARKKRPPGERPRRETEPPISPAGLPDPRAVEGRLRGAAARLGADTPAAQAQALVYNAFEQADPARRVEMAHQALALWPDCADAYVILAEHAPTRKEALELYEQGVAAGTRALGPEMFKRHVGDFWGIPETRPYMRARLGLSLHLWTAGRREEAAAHARDMLRLNPNDNQGVRYTLAGYLLALDQNEELGLLLGQYPDDDTAQWAYSRALLAYRLHGETPQSRALLKAAKKTNKHVIPYLVGDKYPPLEQPPYYSIGDENEALIYLAGSLSAWKNTAGAIDWVRETLKPARRKAPRGPRVAGPSAPAKERLLRLPQTGAVWQAAIRELPTFIEVGRHRQRPWVLLILNQDSGAVEGHDISEEEHSPDQIWHRLAQTFQRPLDADPGRPATLEVYDHPAWRTLAPHLEEIGVNLVFTDALHPLEEALAALGEHMKEGGSGPPALLDVPGMTPEMVGSFYAAAAEFYRQAPWRQVGYESAIRVECAKFQSGPWYAVLMGQSGLTMGLALYEDLDVLRRLWTGNMSDEENARLTVATTVTFGDEMETVPADVDAARRYKWQVARPDAYPSAFRKERGLSMRPPLTWELELLEGCLRAIPDFVRRRRQDDTTPQEMTVPVASGPLTLRLAWIADEAW